MATSLRVGFGQVPVPDVQDQWTDVNDDAQFDPDVGEWIDGNNNGQFDPVLDCRFQKQRPAQGVKDDLMAVAVVIEDGDRRMAIVATDTIGLMPSLFWMYGNRCRKSGNLTALWSTRRTTMRARRKEHDGA